MNQEVKNLDKIHKIGVLMNDYYLSKFEIENLKLLKNSGLNIELYSIFHDYKKENLIQAINRKYKQFGLIRLFEISFFKILVTIEKEILKIFFPKIKNIHNKHLVKKDFFNKIINIKPIFSKNKLLVEYSKKDVELIKNEKLDIIIRGNAKGIFKGEMLKVSKFGIISFHHGDNILNKGGPPGFWEVVLKKPSTGFIIQILNHELDNGKIVFKGECATQKTFLLNQYNVFCESNDFISKSIVKILKEQKINSVGTSSINNNSILKSPSFYFTFKYIFLTLKLFFIISFQKFILKKQQIWEISYDRNHFDKINYQNIKKIKNLPGHFFGDPFVLERNKKHYVFVEDYIKKDSKAVISVIEIDDKDNHNHFTNIIEEDFHLSFPFIFEYENDLFMVPESSENKDIRLYKCLKFPNIWTYCYNLISNIHAADTIIFKKSNLYWLLTTSSKNNDYSSQLNIFYSDNPLSQSWIPHKNNPVKYDINNGRNGGLIIDNNGELIRAIQTFDYNKYGQNQYGRKINLNSIINISKTDFDESFKYTINPDFKKNILGTHTINSTNNFTVFDYTFYEKL
jgi:hypothetical protein